MREVKPTQKPVPSSDIKDLFFNSGLLDIWTTSLEHKYIDRFGNCHLTAAGMEWLFKELVEKFKVDMNIAIVAAGYITIDSFQQGADLPNNELTQRNHILRDETTGEYYRWDGDLPKQVPAGSTPQSTGGIGKGAWVSVGDASLRADLNKSEGAGIVKFDRNTSYPADTVGSKLSRLPFIQLSDFINYPVSNQTEMVRAAHTEANEKNLPVFYDIDELELIGKADIEVRTSIDFNGCTINPKFTGEINYDPTPIYRVTGNEAIEVTSEINPASLQKGTSKLSGGITSRSRGTLWIDSKLALCKRYPTDPLASYFKCSINRLTKFGALQYPLEHDLSSATGLKALYRQDEKGWLRIIDVNIDTSNFNSGVVFGFERSQVNIKDHTVIQGNGEKTNNIRRLYLSGDGISQVKFENISGEGMSSQSASGTYLFDANNTCDVTFDNVTGLQGWGAVTFNKSRDINCNNCHLNRFDGHYHLYDVNISNSSLDEYGVHIGTGGGYLNLHNVTRFIGLRTDVTDGSDILTDTISNTVTFRADYGNYFDGDITINVLYINISPDLKLKENGSEKNPTVMSIVAFYSGIIGKGSTDPMWADYGYTETVPWSNSINIKGVRINAPQNFVESWFSVVGVNFNGRYVEPFVSMPATINADDIQFTKTPTVSKIVPVEFAYLPKVQQKKQVLGSEIRRNTNCAITINNVKSGVGLFCNYAGLNGTSFLNVYYTQAEQATWNTNKIVPHIEITNSAGVVAAMTIAGRVSIDGGSVCGLRDYAAGYNQDTFIKVHDAYIFPLKMNETTTADVTLGRAALTNCQITYSGEVVDVTDCDYIIGTVAENGTTFKGYTVSQMFSGYKKGAGRYQ
ncbi:hypothetical protein VMZ82_001013 [Providencia rettgeri]|nr:hypothetical protein [Providencia rettgeri]